MQPFSTKPVYSSRHRRVVRDRSRLLVNNLSGVRADGVVETGTRVSFKGRAIGVGGVPYASIDGRLLTAWQNELSRRGFTQIRTSGAWLGGEIVAEATLFSDKTRLESGAGAPSVMQDFIGAAVTAGFWNVDNASISVTNSLPTQIENRINDTGGGNNQSGLPDIGALLKENIGIGGITVGAVAVTLFALLILKR